MTLYILLFSLLTAALTAAPAQIILLRHAEKPNEGNELNLKGKERAAALVPFFQGNPEVLEFGTPAAIYAMKASGSSDSLRPIQTVQDIARVFTLPLRSEFARDEYLPMVDEILSKKEYEGKMVLICWEHHLIPAIARALRATGVPDKWPTEVFDRLWILTYNGSVRPHFNNKPQRLLYGDTSH